MPRQVVQTSDAPASPVYSQAVLNAAGSALDTVLSATFILAEEDDFAGMNEEWARWFPDNPPARQGARLPVRPGGMRISVAVIAQA